MNCPQCHIAMPQTTVGGADIGECPQCRGLWFDQGELETVKDEVLPEIGWLEIEAWKARAEFKVQDHHPVANGLEAPFIDIKTDYGANATLMTEYLKAAKIKPSPRLATALFYAIKTDTDNFVRPTVSQDIIAFRYLYEFVNLNIIKKIESSEITQDTLAQYRKAIRRLVVVDHLAVVYMGEVKKPDILVQMADFFMKMAEATGSVTAGIYNGSLILVLRNADFKRNVGKIAQDLFGRLGSAGGHKDSARAEIPLENLDCGKPRDDGCHQYVLQQIRRISK